MARQSGNLSGMERGMSALLGLSLMTLAGRQGTSVLRMLSGLAGTALLARSYAGHCGVKAAVLGHGSLQEGMSDQWKRMLHASGEKAGAKSNRGSAAATDNTVNDSFPASDPPASQLPDEPPVNAEAKWEAVGSDQPNAQ